MSMLSSAHSNGLCNRTSASLAASSSGAQKSSHSSSFVLSHRNSKNREENRNSLHKRSSTITKAAMENKQQQQTAQQQTTVEYQRMKAKEMVKYFKEQQYQQLVEDSAVFGFTKKNEINNGRWTMFGLLVGMMTEYATGVDFIDQIKLLVNVLGIADLD
jgi:hypothetical protein